MIYDSMILKDPPSSGHATFPCLLILQHTLQKSLFAAVVFGGGLAVLTAVQSHWDVSPASDLLLPQGCAAAELQLCAGGGDAAPAG